MDKLNLDDLKNGFFGLSKNIGAFLAEAAMICLDLNNHSTGTILNLSGFSEKSFILDWTDEVTPELSNSWKDLKEATEYGATALAALLIFPISGMVITGRVPQAEQSDYVLQKPGNYNKNSTLPEAFLEVSGILNEKAGNTINMRVEKKKRHIQQGALRNYPTYIIVIEFGIPQSQIAKI
ncbi:MAG: hypothetical protein R2828_21555 [Saprospiraceae bacterium]